MTCLLTFMFTTAFWIALLGYSLRRVPAHIRNNPEAAKAVTDHVITPLVCSAELPFAEEEKS